MTTAIISGVRSRITAVLACPAPDATIDILARYVAELWDFDARIAASISGDAMPPTSAEAKRNASTARTVRRMVEGVAEMTGTDLRVLSAAVYRTAG